jgi:hypothetical protein
MPLICQTGFSRNARMLVVFDNQNGCHVNPPDVRSRSNRLS